jgi:hypothetical protein
MVRQEEHHPEIYELILVLAKWKGRKDESDAGREDAMQYYGFWSTMDLLARGALAWDYMSESHPPVKPEQT